MSAFMNPFFVFAVLLFAWALWRLALWIGSGARLPLRGRRGSASGFHAAGLAGQQFYQPGVKQVIEEQQREAMWREDDEAGEPPAFTGREKGEERSEK